MKFIAASFFLLTTSMVWANPLLLKCTINKELVVLNVEGLISNSCASGTYNVQNGQIKSRYHVTLCGQTNAIGTVSVLTNRGEWIEVDEFSTQGGNANHCYLYRNIATVPRNCPRHSHNCLQ